MKPINKVKFPSILVAMILLAACASTPPPTKMMIQAESRIQQAVRLDAKEYAAAELRSAEKSLEEAKAHIQAENFAEAKRALEKALVTAEYSAIKSRSKKTQATAEQMKRNIEGLQRELES